MAYSDDEAETVIKSVSNYYFVDTEEQPISFSVLPLFDNKGTIKSEKQVFLHGMGDGGLQKVYRQVTSWKLRLEEDEQPEIMVLTKDKKWIQLEEPRKSYMDTIRTVMITAQVLHFLKRKPHSSGKTLWDHVHKVLRMLESRPSLKDLRDHYPLIRRLMERDRALAKSEWLLGFLKEKPGKNPFTVKDDPKEDAESVDGDEEDMDLFDTVCAICDNGGKLLCCEGRCVRSFHATREDGEDSNCKSLGLCRSQVEASQKFLCKNCKYNQHQCFACGKLGSSDKKAGVEVFSCVRLTCGHFYHPECAADLLFGKNKMKAAECEKKIAAGKPFTCPVHKCRACKQEENREVEESQFAVCRRCPTSYHRKCLPREIAYEDIEEEGIVQRAWEYLLPGRVLIYCLKHKIEGDLGTPSRNHLKFPEIVERKKDSDMKKTKVKVLTKSNRIEEAPPVESLLKKMTVPSTHMYTGENTDKRIALGEVENFSEIVNKLRWYVQNDDMIVDFCCGANDFSRLMKEKLDEAGKRCSFKNYDIIRPKYDFNFEKRDWMKVEPWELPTGSKLIVRLGPPSLANKFIDKALTFKPKLLILIIPRGTLKLDSKSPRYDLIWEDCKLLSGKWNFESLSLYLWSRADWTSIYKAIALQRGHASTAQQEPPYEGATQAQSHAAHPPKKQARKKNEGEAHNSPPPETRDSNRDMCKSRHPLKPTETPRRTFPASLVDAQRSQYSVDVPSETPRRTFPASLVDAQRSQYSVDVPGFASGPVHPSTQQSSCGWLED